MLSKGKHYCGANGFFIICLEELYSIGLQNMHQIWTDNLSKKDAELNIQK